MSGHTESYVGAWMLELLGSDLDPMLTKAAEYGGADLEIMGAAMWALVEDKFDLVIGAQGRGKRIGMEMALAFYQLGKVSRMFGAWQSGHEPSNDTYHDDTIYSMMRRFVRMHGHWRITPDGPSHDQDDSTGTERERPAAP